MLRTAARDDGFTLVEMLTVAGIIGILVAVAVASYSVSTGASRRLACLANQRVIGQGLLVYQAQNAGRLPADLDGLRPFVKWSTGQYAKCTVDSVDFEYDDMNGAVVCPNHHR
jgi:prepilin-type N-terminal cleavage/methylation domain-containing protein